MDDPNSHARKHDPAGGWFSHKRALILVLLAATALALYLCYRLARPFLPPLAWAVALAVVAHPLRRWLLQRFPRPNLAAGLTVALVALVIVGPTLLVTQQLVREAATGVAWLQAEGATEHWRTMLAGYPRLGSWLAWLAAQVDMHGAVERTSTALTSGASAVVSGSVWVIAELLMTFLALFYFFRDRSLILQVVRALVPLSPDETEAVFAQVADTLYATVYGTVAVALVQGVFGGLMFWVLGLPAALLCGAVMAVLAVVPVLGAFVMWGPATLFLALQRSWGKALLLVGWGGLVLLYPVLVGQRLRQHTLAVFLAIVGGLELFGSAGVVLGPVTLAITVALVQLWRRRTVGGRTAESGVNA
jgi:predicted PurR-regulated permease PerM